MGTAVLKNRSFHDDVVLRMIFVGMNELANAAVNKYANAEQPILFFFFLMAPTAFFLCFFSIIKQTAFVQDLREFCLFELAINSIYLVSFVLPGASLFQILTPIRAVAIKVIYVALWVRIFWPCQQVALGEYHNWPTFGLYGLWQRLGERQWQICPPTWWQSIAAYAALAASVVIGYCFWHFQISNATVFSSIAQFTILAFLAKTAPPRAMRWWKHHLACIEADRAAKEEALRVASVAKEEALRIASAAKEEAHRAAIAAEHAANEARHIILQQAQQSVDFEAAKCAAELHAKSAQDEAAQLRDQLANPPPEPPPPDPILAMLEPTSSTFNVGLYLTMRAHQERSKHTGKTKQKAKADIYEELAPVAVKLGMTPKWRSKRGQPNRTLLESCIMAGLVGFGEDEQ